MADRLDSVLGISDVPFFQRPISSSNNDQQVGFNELGDPVYRTMSGEQYTVSLADDQRTSNQKIKEDVIPAVKEYAKDPYLPSFDQVLNAGKTVAKGFWDIISLPGEVLSGDRKEAVTYGDIADLSGLMVGGSAFGSRPKDSLGMFLGPKNKGYDTTKLERAEKMKKEGASDDDIWRDTETNFIGGTGWQEINDNRSVTVNTRKTKAADNFDEPPLTAANIDKQAYNAKIKDLKITKKASENEIFMLLQTGQITADAAKQSLAKLDADYKKAISTTDDAVPVINTTGKPAFTDRPLKTRGLLYDVINHDTLFDHIDSAQMPTAQSGFRLMPKNDPNTTGYFKPKNSTSLKKNEDKINVFDLPDKDEEWSTLLHEIQHYMQEVGESTGKGSGTVKIAGKTFRKSEMDIRAIVLRNQNQREAIFTRDGGTEHTLSLEHLLENTGDVKFKSGTFNGGTFNSVFKHHMNLTEILSSIDELASTVDPKNYKSALAKRLKETFPKIKRVELVVDELLSHPSVITLVERVRNARANKGILGVSNDFDTSSKITALSIMPKVKQANILGGKDLSFYMYQANLGETMARLTEKRRNYSSAERKARRPSMDLDIDEDLIIQDKILLD